MRATGPGSVISRPAKAAETRIGSEKQVGGGHGQDEEQDDARAPIALRPEHAAGANRALGQPGEAAEHGQPAEHGQGAGEEEVRGGADPAAATNRSQVVPARVTSRPRPASTQPGHAGWTDERLGGRRRLRRGGGQVGWLWGRGVGRVSQGLCAACGTAPFSGP